MNYRLRSGSGFTCDKFGVEVGSTPAMVLMHWRLARCASSVLPAPILRRTLCRCT